MFFVFFFSSRRRHTRSLCDWSSDVCSSDLDDIVRRLAELAGIADAFTDVFGRVVETPIETRRAILAAFGFPAATEAEGRASLERLQALREGLIPPLVTLEANRPGSVRVRARDGVQAMSFVLVHEDGTTREG